MMNWNPADAVAAGRRMAGRMTQSELAEKLTELTGERWTRDMVANLEGGRRTFDIDTLTAVVTALGVTVEFILFGTDGAGNRVKPGYRDRMLGRSTHTALSFA